MAAVDEVQAQEEEAPVQGDVLEAILSHVPLTDLVGASHVCKSWSQAVCSSLHSLNPPKPWLILHSQVAHPPYATSTQAYDPRSHVWIAVSQPSITYVSALRSSHSNFLYMLSISKFSFCFDPLNIEWHHVDAPRVWRVDPVVAKVGDSIVVAGGACDFEEDPLAVEVFNIRTCTWRTCKPMPHVLKGSAGPTWLSVASTSRKLFVMEKSSGVLHSFDVESNHWSGPHDCRPDQRCFYSLIGSVDDRLILVGLIGDVENVEKAIIWKMDFENFLLKEVGEMPLELIGKLKSETFGFSSIEICSGRGIVYGYNPLEMQEVVVCELIKGGGCSWGSVRNPVGGGDGGMKRLVLTCAEVGVAELQRAMRLGNLRLKEMSFSAVC